MTVKNIMAVLSAVFSCFGGNVVAQCQDSDHDIVASLMQLPPSEHGISSRISGAFRRCGSDSNRICRIGRQLYAESPAKRDKHIGLGIVWRYGTTNDIAFLESCVTNVACGRYAMRVLTKVEGVTSNSVVQLERFRSAIADESQMGEFAVDRAGAVSDLLFAASKIGNLPLRNHIGAYAWSCLSAETNQVATIDSMLAFCDPSYKWSRRRLNVLRQAYAQTPIEAMRACLNARIQELESYPEADLPE